jgi:hypothetical protein
MTIPLTMKYVVVVADEHAALGILLNDEWVEGWDPSPPSNYHNEKQYHLVQWAARYRNWGLVDVPVEHVDAICGLLQNWIINPHINGGLLERNWIDADLPDYAVKAGQLALAKAWLKRAEEEFEIARRRDGEKNDLISKLDTRTTDST